MMIGGDGAPDDGRTAGRRTGAHGTANGGTLYGL